jgi:hypothetical protein
MRGLPLLIALVAGSTLLLRATNVFSEPQQVHALAERLLSDKDFRVRTQAALALGATANPEAIEPLCQAVGDANPTVRAAAAAAMGKLAVGGVPCLEKSLLTESQADVRKVIARALRRLKSSEPKLGPGTKVYVSIGKIESSSWEPGARMDVLARRSLQQYLDRRRGVVTAPQNEPAGDAQRRLKSHPQTKGVLLLPRIHIRAVSGGLQIRFEVAVFSYPERVLKATIRRNLTMPNTTASDTARIRQLIQLAAEALAPDVEETAKRI